MLTGKLKNQVDEVWEAFWTGGIANPIQVIEQFTYLLFIRRLDEIHTKNLKTQLLLGGTDAKLIFADDQDAYRWSKFKNIDPDAMLELMREKIFPFIKTINGDDSAFARHMKDATFMVPTASLLDRVVTLVDGIDMDDRDTKGDLYEYMLSKLSTSGTNGQFRTPRHIIKMMVEITEPRLDGTHSDIICDPASGTCGFLMGAEEYVRRKYGKTSLLKPEGQQHFHQKMFNAYDFDPHMLRIGAMNLMLHEVEKPTVEYRDSLSDQGDNNIKDRFSLILANPPFKGSVSYDELSPDLLTALGKSPKKTASSAGKDEDGNPIKKKGPTEKTELLFLALILRMLQPGGRAAVIVPDGVLFGSTKSHKEIRKTLVEKHKLDAVISLPAGVFKPYAGVKTSILFFTKTGTGGTRNTWYYDMQADGFSLDDKRTALIKNDSDTAENGETTLASASVTEAANAEQPPSENSQHQYNNIPDILYRYANPDAEDDRPRTAQSFYVPKDELASNDYDLSINRYKEVVYEEIQYDSPAEILSRIKVLQKAMDSGITELEGML